MFFVPDEETLAPPALAGFQRAKLETLLSHAYDHGPFYRRKMGAGSARPSPEGFHALPFTTRDELQRDQLEHPPYGTVLCEPLTAYTRLHQTSGSTGRVLRWLDTPESWSTCRKCWSIVFRGAGLEPRDRVAFPFSFGPFIGFWLAFEAAQALGNFCLPGGGMTTAARIDAILENRITFVCCTPTYALRVAEVAAGRGIDLAGSPVRALIVAGEPGANIPSTRRRIEHAWGARVLDHAGMTEIGAWGFECAERPGGMHVIESEFIAEVIDPATGRAVPDGDAGELVLTNLGRLACPLIRYRTGDQVRLTRERCPCGRWFAWAEGGILGRVDDMMFIRGNNVFPATVEAVVREFPQIIEFRLREARTGSLSELHIDIEPAPGADATAVAGRLIDAVRDRLHFRPVVHALAPGALPRFEMKARRFIRET